MDPELDPDGFRAKGFSWFLILVRSLTTLLNWEVMGPVVVTTSWLVRQRLSSTN